MEFTKPEDNFLKKIDFAKKFNFQTKIRWRIAIILTSFHIASFVWFYFYAFPMKWQTLIYGYIIYHLGGIGITCGVHRLWAHKCYKATLPLKIFLALCFASNGQMTIYNWVKIHRQHHKYSDTAADPHDSNRGLFYSHIGWLMLRNSELVKEKRRKIDMSDIEKDEVVMFDKKYTNWLMASCAFLPVLVPIYFWGENWKCAVAWVFFVKNLLTGHGGMTVNSLAHKFGYRPHNKNIKPTNNQLIQWFVFGEGIHNYHHTFPYDYKCAEISDYLNVSTVWIRLWAKMGLAYDLKEPNPDLIKTVVTRLNLTDGDTADSKEKVEM